LHHNGLSVPGFLWTVKATARPLFFDDNNHNAYEQMHKIGIIGGSGLYEIDGLSKTRWRSMKTPFGDPSDSFLTGILDGREVAFLPRHGRGHHISPSELNHRANIWAMKKLGVSWIISVSAVGSLKEKLRPRDIVLIDQFFDRTKQSTSHTFFGNGIVAHVGFARPLCENLRKILIAACRKNRLRMHRSGTYVNMEGPAFSTLAESKAHRKLGFDVVGMTNLGEARCAREAEISYATMAMITDYDCWKEDEDAVSVEMVIENLHQNAAHAKSVIRDAVQIIPADPTWKTHRSLEGAIMTPSNLWPTATFKQLEPILKKYR
jgi:5'-methylthioadenosine phosphorylase